LRAPFRHIAGYVDLLRDTDGKRFSDVGKRYLDEIADSAVFAGTLVDSLLQFSKMGRASLQFSAVDLNLTAAEFREFFQGEIGERKITWRIRELPVVRGDPFMLRLVMQNLLSNAVKYTRPRDEAIIEVGTLPSRTEDIVYVRDNGVGFDMKYQNKLFGVFQRLHRMEEFEGTGIGLASIQRIVLRHGGRVWAEGRVDQGATFYFALPKKETAG
jgi:chemotaxis family two-component system sensor kinase Cph1